MTIWPVARAFHGYEATPPGRPRLPLLTQGGPVLSFGDGWSALGIVPAFAPLHLLILGHPDIGTQLWLLDDRLDWLGEWHPGASTVSMRAALPSPLQHALVAPLEQLRDTGFGTGPAAIDTLRGLALLPVAVLCDLLTTFAEIALPPPRTVVLGDLDTGAVNHVLAGRSFSLPLLRGVLPHTALAPDHPDLAAPTLTRGSPLDGSLLVSQGRWQPKAGWAAHRFIGQDGTAFLLGLSGTAEVPAHLYVPSLDLIVVQSAPESADVASRLRAAYLAEAIRDVPRLSSALSHPDLHLPGDFTHGLEALRALPAWEPPTVAAPPPGATASDDHAMLADLAPPHAAPVPLLPSQDDIASRDKNRRAQDRQERAAWWMKLFAPDRRGRRH